MPAPDVIHNAVKNALIKDGWTITADPYTIEYEEATLYADLAAERPLLAAEQAGRKIAVEIKSFAGRSAIHDFEVALGQYSLYRGFLEVIEPERKLYLAVSHRAFAGFFEQKAIQFIARRYQLAMVVVNVDKEIVTAWKD